MKKNGGSKFMRNNQMESFVMGREGKCEEGVGREWRGEEIVGRGRGEGRRNGSSVG